jgi:hypothetical protein
MNDRADKMAVREWMAGRSQTDASRELGSPQPVLSMWLSGHRELAGKTMLKWAGVTGIPLELFATCKVKAAA